MEFGDTEIMRQEGDIRLLKIGCRNDKISYCVLGNGSTIIMTIMKMHWRNSICVG